MLIGSVFATATGIQAASTYLDVTGSNIANAATTGFKSQETAFHDLVYAGPPAGGGPAGAATPVGTQLGTGAAVVATTGQFTQGGLTQTGNTYDLAINGNGFFKVTLADGTAAYTRDGSFRLDGAGNLVTAGGAFVNGPITVPTGASQVTIGPDGTVTATTAGVVQTLGQIGLTNFQSPTGLARVGDDLFLAGPASGPGADGAPNTNGLGTITQGSVENSNVSLSTELVNLIIAQNAFTSNTQALTAENETLSTTIQLVQ